MKKNELVNSVAENCGLSKTDSERAVDAVFNTITKALVENDQVTIQGFGIFSTKKRAARMGRDPRTGNPVPIAASNKASFKPAKALKDAVNTAVPA